MSSIHHGFSIRATFKEKCKDVLVTDRKYQVMFKSQKEIEDYLKQFLVEKNKVDSTYLLSRYFELHSERLFKTYKIIQSHQNQFNNKVLLDLGSSNGLFLPIMQAIVPFEDINVIDYGTHGCEVCKLESANQTVSFKRHYLNLEKDKLPFEDNSVDVILFFEVLEHFTFDAMHVLLEINRILKADGFLFMSTPNLNSGRSFLSMLRGDNPNLFTAYKPEEQIYARHNREYSINEVKLLFENSGFFFETFTTILHSDGSWNIEESLPTLSSHIDWRLKLFFVVMGLLNRLGISILKEDELGNYIFGVCKKAKHLDANILGVKTRFPRPIYGDGFYPTPATFPETVMSQH